MEPRIQYAQTADGVSIAFWTLGEGTPLVYMRLLQMGSASMEWQIPEYRRWYEALAQGRKLITYDGRGSGLSDRDVTDFSLDAQILDVQAVVDALGLERFALWAPYDAGAVAIAYAAGHPDQVSDLLLWSAVARVSDLYGARQVQALLTLIDQDWDLFTETLVHAALGWSTGEPARRVAALLRQSVTPQVTKASMNATREFDVTDLLQEIRTPTLLLHRRESALLEMDVAKGLASRIPGARLAVLEGESGMPYLGDTEAVLAAIDEFLAEGEEAGAPGAAPSGLVTILFTDMEGSTTLTQRVGDAKAQEVLRTHNAIVRNALKAHDGSEIKHTGDGIMASFPSASRALECAIVIQRAVASRVQEQPDMPLRVRVGLNAGEPVVEEQDLFGTAVQLAARICAHAEPGQILAPTVVRELAAGKGFLLADLGQAVLRGFEDPVRLYEVRWRDKG